MAEQPSKYELSKYEREVRDTIVKSGLSGVAMAALAVTVCSPVGFGGMIGSPFASAMGFDSTSDVSDNPYAALPAYPEPMTADELERVRGELATSGAMLELTRAATDDKIEHMRRLALGDDIVTFTPSAAPLSASVPDAALRLTLSQPAPFDEAPVEAYVMDTSPAEASVTPVNYSGGAVSEPYRDPHLELADLLLAHETL